MDDDGRELFIEASEEHIRAWDTAAKLCERDAHFSAEQEAVTRHSACWLCCTFVPPLSPKPHEPLTLCF